jgi:hypothetical protein
MRLLHIPIVSSIAALHLLAAAEPQSKAPSIPWLRTYSEYVHGIYLDLSKVSSVSEANVDHVLVAISPKNVFTATPTRRQIRLTSYVQNDVKSEVGCIFHPNDSSISTDRCGKLWLKSINKFQIESQKCDAAKTATLKTWLFVDNKMKGTLCLGESVADQYVQNRQTKIWIRQHIDVTARHTEKSRIAPEVVMGQNAYLGLESNRLFGCFTYGVPVTYRSKETTPTEATNTLPEYDENFYRLPPIWQYQYLIKTRGFLYYCKQSKRFIDEVEAYGITLTDGTALLRGNVSVLRIRTVDGSTDAPGLQVKRIAPALTRKRIHDAIGEKNLKANPDICNPSISSECPLGNNKLIQGIDQVMQSFFSKP